MKIMIINICPVCKYCELSKWTGFFYCKHPDIGNARTKKYSIPEWCPLEDLKNICPNQIFHVNVNEGIETNHNNCDWCKKVITKL